MKNAPGFILRAAAIFAVAGLSLTALQGQTLPATQPAADLDHLIKQLGSDNPQDRDSAQNQLVDLGPSVIPALKKAAENDDDPEIRSRAAAAISQMKDHDANDASLITIHHKDGVPSQVLDEIAAQAHTHFTGYAPGMPIGNGNRTVNIDADRKPFWDVMTDVCTQLNVCPTLDLPGKNSIMLYVAPRNWLAVSPHQIIGPYWIGVAGIDRTRNIDLMGPPVTTDQFMIKMVVYPEPKLAVTQMSDFNLKEATDDAGNSLLPISQPGMSRMVIRRSMGIGQTIDSRLSYPKNPGKKISILRGDVIVLLAEDIQQFQQDDVLGSNPRTTNPIKNCIVQANVALQSTDIWRVTLRCTRQGVADEQWTAMMNRMTDLALEDADGHSLFLLPRSTGVQATETTFVTTASFSKNMIGFAAVRPGAAKVGDPKRFTWNVATSSKSVTVPVTFRDLPMP